MKRSFPDAIFVLMGDDVMYLEDIAGLLPDCFVSHNSPHTDFALMTLCHHGILSASSFAWWGSTYACNYHQFQSLYFAPKYWIGYRTNSWNPPFMKSTHLTYLV